MKQLIIAMIITNIIVIAQIMVDRKIQQEEKLNKQICMEELVPIDEFEVIGD